MSDAKTESRLVVLGEAGVTGSIHVGGTTRVLAAAESEPHYITAVPQLPPFDIELSVSGYSLDGELTYTAWIEYREHGRDDVTARLEGRSAGLSFSVSFGDTIQGGVFVIDLEVPMRRDSDGRTRVFRPRGVVEVRGTNPTKANVKAHLRTVALQVTAYRESRFRQFDGDRLPLFGSPNGFGIMQLDNPPATARQIWDWKANVDAGISLFEQKGRDAETYPSRVRRQHPDATDFTVEQLRLETYQRYNGGSYWDWAPENGQWVRNPPNGYADESLRIQELVENGTPPADWN